ncbi:transposase, partial [Shigella boydii]
STLKSPSYTKSVSWQHYRMFLRFAIETISSIFLTGSSSRIWLR